MIGLFIYYVFFYILFTDTGYEDLPFLGAQIRQGVDVVDFLMEIQLLELGVITHNLEYRGVIQFVNKIVLLLRSEARQFLKVEQF